MLDASQYLSGDPDNGKGGRYNYAFAYDGVYVDRTLDDFLSAQETTYTDLTKGNWNEYATPAGNKQGMAYPDINCRETLAVTSVRTRDPNHCSVNDPNYVNPVGPLNHDPYADNVLFHRLAQMETSSVRGKQVTLNGVNTTIFGYDNSNNDVASPVSYSPESQAKDANIPDGALYAGDYVEYVVRVGNKAADAAGGKYDVPLESVDARFQVEKGQRIVGWEVQKVKQADGTWTEDNPTGLPVTAEIGDDALAALRDAPAQTDLSVVGGVEQYDQNLGQGQRAGRAGVRGRDDPAGGSPGRARRVRGHPHHHPADGRAGHRRLP